MPSLLQLQAETARRGWQRLVGWDRPISDDAFGYVLERYCLEDLREVLVADGATVETDEIMPELDAFTGFDVRCDAREGR